MVTLSCLSMFIKVKKNNFLIGQIIVWLIVYRYEITSIMIWAANGNFHTTTRQAEQNNSSDTKPVMVNTELFQNLTVVLKKENLTKWRR